MDMSLFDMVATENYSPDLGGQEFVGLDPATEADINDRITDDSTSVFAYTSECMESMLALEAAEAKMEGLMAVKLLNGRMNGDEDAMESAVITMEGFVGNVWEAIKELVERAYAAIKNFLIKAWNKFKGYANVVKAFFGKYGDVLRSRRVPGCMVKWTTINVLGGEKVYDHFYGIIHKNLEELAAAKTWHKFRNSVSSLIHSPDNKDQAYKYDRRPDAGYQVEKHLRRDMNVRTNGIMKQKLVDVGGLPSPHEVNGALNKAIYPHGDTTSEVAFESIRGMAIEAADISTYKKYIDNFLALGDKAHRESLKCIENAKRAMAEYREQDRSSGVSTLHSGMRRCLNAEIELHRLCMHGMYTAAKRMQSQSISACRKAIMFHSTKGAGATYSEESYAPQYYQEPAYEGYEGAEEGDAAPEYGAQTNGEVYDAAAAEGVGADYFDQILSDMGY